MDNDSMAGMVHYEAVDTRCPDCGERGNVISGETTCMGNLRDDMLTLRQEGGLVCCRDPNRTTETRECTNGHRWRVAYKILCWCSVCRSLDLGARYERHGPGLERLVALIQKLEWCEASDDGAWCPACRADKDFDGTHNPGCEIAEVINWRKHEMVG